MSESSEVTMEQKQMPIHLVLPEQPFTLQEAISMLNTYSQVISNQQQIIALHEKQEIEMLNHIFSLGRELDEVTDVAFKSPYVQHKEHIV